MPNVFESLLNSIDEADRPAFSSMVEKYPAIKDHIGDPKQIAKVDNVEKWYATNWDFEHACTKEEWARKLRIEALDAQRVALETQLAEATNGEQGMTFEDLNKFLDDRIKDGKVVSAAQMKDEVNGIVAAKEGEFNKVLNAIAATSTQVPYLNQMHQRDFGEMFDPDEFLTKANEAKATDLKEFYAKTFAAEKIAAKQKADTDRAQADLDAKLAAAKLEGRKEALMEKVTTDGQVPSIEGSPEMGHFQMRMMKVAPVDDKTKSTVPADAELGRNTIATAAARDFERQRAEGAAA